MRGSRPWFINRQLCSTHIDLVKKMGFSLRAQITQLGDYGIPRKQLAKVFQKLSESDLLTAGVFILASKSA
jgi:hypothetical protein